MRQAAHTVLLVRPACFGYNAETAASNAFQKRLEEQSDVSGHALVEFDGLVAALKSNGIRVIVQEDTAAPQKPDAVFPNNWISLHHDGTLVLYPMLAPSRRLERSKEITQWFRDHFEVKHILDLSANEHKGQFLEGTGSIVFDHPNKIAYACLSPRTHDKTFIDLSDNLNYKPVCFHGFNETGKEIYHTNVMMCIAEQFAVICAETIREETERNKTLDSLGSTGHEIILINQKQMNQFAGNMLALQTPAGKQLLVLSTSALQAISPDQQQRLEQYCKLIPVSIPTIERNGGGSVRCMIAEVFLPEKIFSL